MTQQTFIWDVDGVLVWYHPDNANLDWRKRLSDIDALDIWEAFQRSPEWHACLRDQTLDTRAHFAQFLEGGSIRRKDYKRIFDIWLTHNTKVSEPALARLKGLMEDGRACAIGSNQDGIRGAWLNQWLDGQALDMPRFISAEINAAKPDKEFFVRIGQKLNEPPEALCLLDDKLENIRGAEAAGWRGVYIDSRYRKNPDLWYELML